MKLHLTILLLGVTSLGSLLAQPAAPKTSGQPVAPAALPGSAGSVSSAIPLPAGPDKVGAWSDTISWGLAGTPAGPLIAIHSHLLPTGQVLSWGYDVELWNPATGLFTLLSLAHCNVFCSGHSFLPDGRLLVAGGHDNPVCY